MPCLSREQLEQIADGVIHQYKAALVPEKHLCYNVDPTELASLLGYTVDYQYLTKDGSESMRYSLPVCARISKCQPTVR